MGVPITPDICPACAERVFVNQYNELLDREDELKRRRAELERSLLEEMFAEFEFDARGRAVRLVQPF